MNLGDNLSEYVIAFVQQELFGTQKPPFTIDENFPINVGEYPIDSEDADELLVAFAENSMSILNLWNGMTIFQESVFPSFLTAFCLNTSKLITTIQNH
ncbi:Uncharacterised protein [Serratia plymuthica]|uniref:Uncharacterized protein n=1 Tax=Serratia plymuthica TaxID=82996 RepID=A0A2X4U3S6_SERPL|nr:Uncharacterised protein [Serratia plymuthica]